MFAWLYLGPTTTTDWRRVATASWWNHLYYGTSAEHAAWQPTPSADQVSSTHVYDCAFVLAIKNHVGAKMIAVFISFKVHIPK